MLPETETQNATGEDTAGQVGGEELVETVDNTGDSSDDIQDDNTGDSSASQDDNKDHSKKSNNLQNRFNEMTAKNYTVESEKRRLAEENAELKKQIQNNQGQTVTKNQEAEGRPNYEDFETDDAYYEALSAYNVGQEINKYKAQVERDNIEKSEADIESKYQSRLRENIGDYPDFVETIEKAGVRLNSATERFVKLSDNPAGLIYHLAKNPELAESLGGMTSLDLVKKLAVVESKLNEKPTQKKVSNAPDPEKILNGNAGIEKNPDDMSMKEYAAWREAGNGGPL